MAQIGKLKSETVDTIVNLKAYSQSFLATDLTSLNARIENLMDPNELDVTPLLKFYDKIVAHC